MSRGVVTQNLVSVERSDQCRTMADLLYRPESGVTFVQMSYSEQECCVGGIPEQGPVTGAPDNNGACRTGLQRCFCGDRLFFPLILVDGLEETHSLICARRAVRYLAGRTSVYNLPAAQVATSHVAWATSECSGRPGRGVAFACCPDATCMRLGEHHATAEHEVPYHGNVGWQEGAFVSQRRAGQHIVSVRRVQQYGHQGPVSERAPGSAATLSGKINDLRFCQWCLIAAKRPCWRR